MDMLVCLIGRSGSGKTTVANAFKDKGCNIIDSYTTRPPRYKGEGGHVFIKDLRVCPKQRKHVMITYDDESILVNDMIAYANLYDKHYFATKSQYLGKGVSFYVVDPSGYNQVLENVKDTKVVGIYIDIDKDIATKRLINRYLIDNTDHSPEDREIIANGILTWGLQGQSKEKDKLSKYVNERLDNDDTIFNITKCDYVVDGNKSIEEVVASIDSIIKSEGGQYE